MSRIDPQFGRDFRPGYRPDYSPDYSLFALLPQEEHRDDHHDLEAGRKTARGTLPASPWSSGRSSPSSSSWCGGPDGRR
jgi:hypothetical protein